MKNRGYSVIGLDNPKSLQNLGGAMRAAHCYGASMIVIGGQRIARLGKLATDTTKAYRHIPSVFADDVLGNIPYDCIPVAVDLVDGARPLQDYTHPERAFYVFGPEDGTLGEHILTRCRDRVMVPTTGCMNLAATVNVVLYDRVAKALRSKPSATAEFVRWRSETKCHHPPGQSPKDLQAAFQAWARCNPDERKP